MHINESSGKKLGGTVNVHLGRYRGGYRGAVNVNLGRFGRFGADWSNPSSIYTDPPAAVVDDGNTYYGPGSPSGWTMDSSGDTTPYVSPVSNQTYTSNSDDDEDDSPGALDWIAKLLGTAGSIAPGIITAVRGPTTVVGGAKQPGPLYQNPVGNSGILVPVAIGAIALVGAALVLKGSRKGSGPAAPLSGYKRRRKLRRNRR